VAILSRKRGIYCLPEKWKRIRRRARKAGLPISRLVVLCCQRAASGSGVPPEPPGHRVGLPEDVQRRLLKDCGVLARSGRVVVRAPGGGKATLAIHEVVRFLLLSERAGEG